MCNKEIKLDSNGLKLELKGYSVKEVKALLPLLPLPTVQEVNIKIPKNIKTEKEKTIRKNNEKQDIELFNLKDITSDVKLPTLCTDFRCPDCKQGLMLIHTANDNSSIIYNNLRGDLCSVDIEAESVLNVFKERGDKELYTLIGNVYKDVTSIGTSSTGIKLVSDSQDVAICPVCGEQHTISEFIHAYDDMDVTDYCIVCGCENENIISQNEQKTKCENNCLSKLH